MVLRHPWPMDEDLSSTDRTEVVAMVTAVGGDHSNDGHTATAIVEKQVRLLHGSLRCASVRRGSLDADRMQSPSPAVEQLLVELVDDEQRSSISTSAPRSRGEFLRSPDLLSLRDSGSAVDPH